MKELEKKLKNKNEILFSKDSECLKELLSLIEKQKHRTLVLWAFVCMDKICIDLKEKYPDEKRIDLANKLCKMWARGEIKMPIAKKALLDVHAIAKEISSKEDIALFHAVGQACSTVHVKTHAIGLAIYELTAIVRKYGFENCKEHIDLKILEYINSLKECENEIEVFNYKWAKFLLVDKKTIENIANKC